MRKIADPVIDVGGIPHYQVDVPEGDGRNVRILIAKAAIDRYPDEKQAEALEDIVLRHMETLWDPRPESDRNSYRCGIN